MEYLIYVKMEAYLQQWIMHQAGGQYPIRIKRGSAEADIIEVGLKKQPKREGYKPQLKEGEGEVSIVLPWFRSKDIRTYNYVEERTKKSLHETLRVRFRVALWKALHKVEKGRERIDMKIMDFMERNGIEIDDRNYNTIVKIYLRLRKVYDNKNEKNK